jgi:hypothetical protein
MPSHAIDVLRPAKAPVAVPVVHSCGHMERHRLPYPNFVDPRAMTNCVASLGATPCYRCQQARQESVVSAIGRTEPHSHRPVDMQPSLARAAAVLKRDPWTMRWFALPWRHSDRAARPSPVR